MSYTTIATATPSGGLLTTTINFSGQSDVPNISGWQWYYGDGQTASGQESSHQYSSSNMYTAWVVASGNVSNSPSGVYLDTYIQDDFNTGVYDSGWDSEFTSLGIDDGYAGIGNLDKRMIPSGVGNFMCGRFDLQWDYRLGANGGANTSEHIRLFDTSDVELVDLMYYGFAEQFEVDSVSQGVDAPDVSGRNYTTRLIRGYTLSSSGTLTSGSLSETRWYYLDNWSGGASNDWREFTDSPVITETGCVYVEWNAGTNHGIDNVIFQADSGLPYMSSGNFVLDSGNVLVTISGLEYDIYGSGIGKGRVFGDRQIIYKATPFPPSGVPIYTLSLIHI